MGGPSERYHTSAHGLAVAARCFLAGQPNLFITVRGTPDANVAFMYGFAPGTAPVDGCPGVTVGLNNPRKLGTRTANENGTAHLTQTIPPGFAGQTLLFQAIDRASCRVSNRVVTVFQ